MSNKRRSKKQFFCGHSLAQVNSLFQLGSFGDIPLLDSLSVHASINYEFMVAKLSLNSLARFNGGSWASATTHKIEL